MLQNKTVVRAGVNQKKVPYYVGRAFFENQLIVGRVPRFGDKHYVESLYLDGEDYHYQFFDVLVYEDPFHVEDRRT